MINLERKIKGYNYLKPRYLILRLNYLVTAQKYKDNNREIVKVK